LVHKRLKIGASSLAAIHKCYMLFFASLCNGRSASRTRANNGSAGHGSWVKWVNKCEWVTWVTGQYRNQ